jgi:HEAT repeat protein
VRRLSVEVRPLQDGVRHRRQRSLLTPNVLHVMVGLSDRQLDLFAASGVRTTVDASTPVGIAPLAPRDLCDDALIAALPAARLVDCHALCAEVGSRGLTAAIPGLEALCRRFKGFGLQHQVPEQIAALHGLSAFGTPEAAAALSRILADNVVQGPGVHHAVAAAVRLKCRLPVGTSLALLRHGEAEVRAGACKCARPHSDVIAVLIDLLDDLNQPVAAAAACALGRAGNAAGRPLLTCLLRLEPTEEIIDAVWPVADEECIVQLGRIARTNPMLSPAAISALESTDHPRAQTIVARLHSAT